MVGETSDTTCCEESHEVDAFENDPALADCCRRDLREQAHVQRVRDVLLEHDVTTERQKLVDSVFLRDPHALPCLPQSDKDSLESDSEDDGLSQARSARLAELKREQGQRLYSQDVGDLKDIEAAQLPAFVMNNTYAAAICHTYMPGSSAEDQLDELLSSLAHQYRGTCFLRAPCSHAVGLQPGLLCFKGGLQCAGIPLEHLGTGGDIDDDVVLRELRQCGVLLKETGKYGAAGREQKIHPIGDSSEEEQAGWQEPCTICGRRYYHEHMRSISKGNVRPGADDGDE